MMHKYPRLMKHHQLHHRSLASRAISGFYMAPVDFFLEHHIIQFVVIFHREIGPA